MRAIPFRKMHGLGNDFVVVDARARAPGLSDRAIRALGDRRRGVGFDQLLVLEKPLNGGDLFMRIYNPDGSEARACGNGTRCVARLAMDESGAASAVIETVAGDLRARREDDLVAVDMGRPRLDWAMIPMAQAVETAAFTLPGAEALGPASAVSMGNPHVVFFVPDLDAVTLADVGPRIETHPWFPDRVNVSIATVAAPGAIRVKVWERGAGATLACGTGACATLVAAARRSLSPRRAQVALPGGVLSIDWAADDHVWMTGPTADAFTGAIDPALFEALP